MLLHRSWHYPQLPSTSPPSLPRVHLAWCKPSLRSPFHPHHRRGAFETKYLMRSVPCLIFQGLLSAGGDVPGCHGALPASSDAPCPPRPTVPPPPHCPRSWAISLPTPPPCAGPFPSFSAVICGPAAPPVRWGCPGEGARFRAARAVTCITGPVGGRCLYLPSPWLPPKREAVS